MSVTWYDPISEKWHAMPQPPAPVVIHDPANNSLADALRGLVNDRIWRALVASATASTMSEEPTHDQAGAEAAVV